MRDPVCHGGPTYARRRSRLGSILRKTHGLIEPPRLVVSEQTGRHLDARRTAGARDFGRASITRGKSAILA